MMLFAIVAARYISIAMLNSQIDHSADRSSPMKGAIWNCEHLARLQCNGLSFQIDLQFTFLYEKRFVTIRMFVPVKIPVKHANSNYVVVYARQHEVIPVVRNAICEFAYVN
jgi:hypothetical protein